jgi:hypothetical protein
MCCWLICLRTRPPGWGGHSATGAWIEWATPDELVEADRVLLDDERGCGDGHCERAHLLVWWDGSRYIIRPSVHDPQPPTLAEQLRQLYPTRAALHRPKAGRKRKTPPPPPPPPDPSPVLWPAPADFNEELVPEPTGSALLPRIDRAHAEQIRRSLATVEECDYADVFS